MSWQIVVSGHKHGDYETGFADVKLAILEFKDAVESKGHTVYGLTLNGETVKYTKEEGSS